MSWELSQRTKTMFDIIRTGSSLIAVSGLALYLIALSQGDQDVYTSFLGHHKWISLVLGILILLAIFPGPLIIDLLQWLFIYLKRRSNYIIEYQTINVDITEKGKLAYFNELTEFCKIGKGQYQNYDAHVRVSGVISPLSKFNCNYEWENEGEHNDLTLNYTNGKKKKKSYYSRLVKAQNENLMFSAVFHDTFTSTTETWDYTPKHYCRNYHLEIILPIGCKLKSVEIYNLDSQKVLTKYKDARPIKTIEHGRHKIIMKLTDVDAPDRNIPDDLKEKIRLQWEWEF